MSCRICEQVNKFQCFSLVLVAQFAFSVPVSRWLPFTWKVPNVIDDP